MLCSTARLHLSATADKILVPDGVHYRGVPLYYKFLRQNLPSKYSSPIHCKNKLAVSTTEWLPWLRTNWRDGGYERFALVLETNCKRKLKGQLPSSSYNHNTLKTLIIFVVHSPGYKFLTATLKCICN